MALADRDYMRQPRRLSPVRVGGRGLDRSDLVHEAWMRANVRNNGARPVRQQRRRRWIRAVWDKSVALCVCVVLAVVASMLLAGALQVTGMADAQTQGVLDLFVLGCGALAALCAAWRA